MKSTQGDCVNTNPLRQPTHGNTRSYVPHPEMPTGPASHVGFYARRWERGQPNLSGTVRCPTMAGKRCLGPDRWEPFLPVDRGKRQLARVTPQFLLSWHLRVGAYVAQREIRPLRAHEKTPSNYHPKDEKLGGLRLFPWMKSADIGWMGGFGGLLFPTLELFLWILGHFLA